MAIELSPNARELEQLADNRENFVDLVNPHSEEARLIYIEAALYRIGAHLVEELASINLHLGTLLLDREED